MENHSPCLRDALAAALPAAAASLSSAPPCLSSRALRFPRARPSVPAPLEVHPPPSCWPLPHVPATASLTSLCYWRCRTRVARPKQRQRNTEVTWMVKVNKELLQSFLILFSRDKLVRYSLSFSLRCLPAAFLLNLCRARCS